MTYPKFPIKELVDCANRELALRLREYPGLVREKKMLPAAAELEVAKMEAIRDILKGLQQSDNGLLDQTIPGNI